MVHVDHELSQDVFSVEKYGATLQLTRSEAQQVINWLYHAINAPQLDVTKLYGRKHVASNTHQH